MNLVHTWPPVYTDLFFVIGHVVFVGFLSSLVCVHAPTYSSPCAAHGDSISCLIVGTSRSRKWLGLCYEHSLGVFIKTPGAHTLLGTVIQLGFFSLQPPYTCIAPGQKWLGLRYEHSLGVFIKTPGAHSGHRRAHALLGTVIRLFIPASVHL
jgi:hypothetical protein